MHPIMDKFRSYSESCSCYSLIKCVFRVSWLTHNDLVWNVLMSTKLQQSIAYVMFDPYPSEVSGLALGNLLCLKRPRTEKGFISEAKHNPVRSWG